MAAKVNATAPMRKMRTCKNVFAEMKSLPTLYNYLLNAFVDGYLSTKLFFIFCESVMLASF